MKQINFRTTEEEDEHLKRYCDVKKRQQSEVLRELIRKLSIKGALNPLD